jgi:hypothetical protein
MIRLAAVDGERTEGVDRDPILQQITGFAHAIQDGLKVDKAIIVAQIDGAVDYTVAGTITLSEAIGLLTLASRAMERNVRGD